MSKIKKFFQRKKQEASKLLGTNNFGEGRALNAPAPAPKTSKNVSQEKYVPPKHKEISEEARAAANAALSRIQPKSTTNFATSLAAVKAQAKRELEAERKQREESESSVTRNESTTSSTNTNLACQGVYFRCPLISDEVLPKKEWLPKIKEFLYQQLQYEPGLTACLIISNCNVKDKADDCIATLTKYLENIINHPEEEKYRKIRQSNRVFSEKVRYVEGAMEFLHAAGFRDIELDGEPFLIWTAEEMEQDIDLRTLLESLQNTSPIQLELDRNIRVLLPSQARRVVLPDDFYRISPEEAKREQQKREEANANAQVLRTKAMREREEQRLLRIYRYSLIRVKFPNGFYLQGTFNVYEKICNVYEFVRSCLQDENTEFHLIVSGEGKLTEEDMNETLQHFRLVPNAMLVFVASDLKHEIASEINFLKEDLILLVQSL